MPDVAPLVWRRPIRSSAPKLNQRPCLCGSRRCLRPGGVGVSGATMAQEPRVHAADNLQGCRYRVGVEVSGYAADRVFACHRVPAGVLDGRADGDHRPSVWRVPREHAQGPQGMTWNVSRARRATARAATGARARRYSAATRTAEEPYLPLRAPKPTRLRRGGYTHMPTNCDQGLVHHSIRVYHSGTPHVANADLSGCKSPALSASRQGPLLGCPV